MLRLQTWTLKKKNPLNAKVTFNIASRFQTSRYATNTLYNDSFGHDFAYLEFLFSLNWMLSDGAKIIEKS